MTQKDNILQELTELKSILANLPAQNVYSVPVGYFDGLAVQVLNRIKAMEATRASEETGHLSPILSSISKQMPYTLPAGYFEGLDLEHITKENDDLSAKEELETLSPLLAGLKKEMPYQVPQGYFDNLAPAIPADEDQSATKVVSLGSRKWFRYAAAAVMVGVIAAISILIINRDKVTAYEDSYAWVKKSVKKVSTEKLEEFIQLADAEKSVASADSKLQQEVKELVKDVPQKEIQNFLNDIHALDDTDDASEEVFMN
ncbi:MAG: hypothetical protein ABL876_11080 [Chitinophagaceae bacterium]